MNILNTYNAKSTELIVSVDVVSLFTQVTIEKKQ